MSGFEVFMDDAETPEYRWRLRADNGEIVAVSEGYTEKESAVEGVKAAIRAVLATVTAEIEFTNTQEDEDVA